MYLTGTLELVAVIDGKDGEQGPQGIPGQTGPAGADAYMVSISPNSVTLECDSEGNVLDNEFISVQPSLEKGGTEISYVLSSVSGGKLLAVADNGAIKIYGRLCKWSATGYDDLYTIKDYPDVAVYDIAYKIVDGVVVDHYYVSAVGTVFITVQGVRYDRVVGECYAANLATPAEVQFTISNNQQGFLRVYKFQVTADRASESPVSWVDSKVNNTGEWNANNSYRYSGVRRDFCYRTKVSQSDGSIGITGYVVSEYWRGQGSFTSATPPEEDNDKIVGLQKPHWKVVSYQDIGFFGSVIATLVSAKTGDFDKLVAKDCLFDNITLTGVLNNLAQTLTYNTLSQYGYVAGNTFYINPLKIGQYVYFDWNGALDTLGVTTIYLPCVYSAAGSYTPEFGGYKANGERFTLVEMRQMVGKKIMLMPLENISGAPIIRSVYKMLYAHIPYFEAFSDESTENFDYDLNNFDNAVAGKRASIIKERLQVCGYGEYQLPTTEASCFLLECKAGLYKDHDCVYWEITQRQYALIEE